ncbi:MAG TPA: response regulator [Chthoniobacterales bacterium]|nr:response regulator [Chthoniobacterales bacterium]
MSLTKKLVLTFLLVTLIPIGVIIWVSRQTLVEQAQQQIGIQLKDSVVQVGKSMDEFMFNSLRNVQTMAVNPDLSLRDLNAADHDLARLTYSFSFFDQVMLVNPLGVIIASSDSTNLGQSLFTDFANTRNEFAMAVLARPGSAYVSLTDALKPPNSPGAEERQSNQLFGIQILVPVEDSEGRPVGVLVANVLTRQLLWLLQDLKRQTPGGESPCLVDRAGLVLISADPRGRLVPAHADVTSRALGAALGSVSSGHLVYTDSRGNKLMAGYTELATYGDNKTGGWRLISLVPYETIMRPANESFNRMMGILLATLLAAGILGALVARRQVKPLLKLTEGAKTIAAGNYDTRVVATTHDEIGVLANTFNQMAEAMEKRASERSQAQEALSRANNELEQRVEERTLQLARAFMIMRATLESTTDGILVTDDQLEVVDSNAKYVDIWEIPEKAMKAGVPRQVRELASQRFADPQRFVARIEEIGATDQESFDLLEPKDGRIFERYSKVLRVEGKRAGRVWSFRDVTERHLAEITSRRLAAIVASTDDAIVGEDLNGFITDWNFGAERIFGYSSAEMIGSSIMRLIPAERQQEELEILSRIRRGERVDHFESVGLTKGGRQLNCAITVSPIKDSAVHVVGASKVIRDMTERKRAELELQNAKKAAEAANQAKSQFLANMSHEIRTPMNGVIGMTALLLEGDLNPQQRDFAETALASADALLKIINDILDFSKIEAGKLSFELLDFDLIDAVESTLDLLAELAQVKGTELVSEMTPDLPTQLRGDPGRLRQILTNLIGNAIKFTEGGEVVLSISMKSETATHARLHFRVKDTGIGISSEGQRDLFKAFSQADGSTTRKHGGTGLGLAIAKQLAGLMDGEIGVQSKLGEGSIFWFTVELEKQASSARDLFPSPQNLDGMRVLAVDDNATNRRILRLQLAKWKMEVETAANGQEALKMMREAASAEKPYGLALLDVQMPQMDGWMLARSIRADPALVGTLLIVLTSSGQTLSPAELKAAGIEAYLVKPVKQARLLDCLVSSVGRKNTCTLTVAATTAISSEPNPVLDKVRILLAEDNRVNQKVALARLQKMGYGADAAANGVEVLEALRRLPYDLILMDCQMPEMDGYEATLAIRQAEQSLEHPCPWNAPIYIIAMTAHAMEGDREKCLAVGMDDYLSKPMLVPELRVALKRWERAAQHRARQSVRV